MTFGQKSSKLIWSTARNLTICAIGKLCHEDYFYIIQNLPTKPIYKQETGWTLLFEYLKKHLAKSQVHRNFPLKRISPHSNKVAAEKKNHKITHCMTLLKAKSRILQTFILRISGKNYIKTLCHKEYRQNIFFVWFEVIDQEMCHSFHCVRDAVMKTVTTHYFAHCPILIKTISTLKLLWIDPCNWTLTKWKQIGWKMWQKGEQLILRLPNASCQPIRKVNLPKSWNLTLWLFPLKQIMRVPFPGTITTFILTETINCILLL